jgi:hypothetical protein
MRGDVGAGPEPEAPEVQEPVVQAAPEPTATPEGEPAAPGSERDEKGRFKAKNTDVEPTEGAGEPAAAAPAPEEPAKPEKEEPQTGAIRIPPSLPAAVKAKWSDLEPEVQQAFAKLEDTVQTAKAEWGRKGERLNRYDEILGPHLDRWRLAGLDEFSGVQSLLAAQQLLDRNPVEGIIQIARSYGYTPQHLVQAFGLPQTSAPQPGAEGHTAPTAQPDLQAALRPLVEPLMSEVQTLKQHLEGERSTAAQRTVEEFASRPENKYFENVREDVAILLETGRARTLQEAYDHACWLNPEVRAALLAEQSRETQRAAQTAEAERKAQEQARARAKAQTATAAAGSVTGSPTPGLAPAQGRSTGNLRDDLLAAKQELSQQV